MAVRDVEFYLSYLIVLCNFGLVLLGAPMPKYNEEKCVSISADTCFKDIQVFLKLSSLPFTSKSEELDKLCERCLSGYNCTQDLMANNRDCLTQQDRDLVQLFVPMAQYTYFMLCGDGTSTEKAYLRESYLEYSQCIYRHEKELKCCVEQTHIPDIPAIKIREELSIGLRERQISNCCPVSRFIQCASDVAMQCGDGAANLTEHYIRRAAGEPVQKLCQDLPQFPEPDSVICPEQVPTCSGCVVFHLDKCVLLATLIFLIWRLKV